MAVYEISGKPMLTPTSARAGGTLVEGIINAGEDAITVLIPFRGELVRVGLGAKGGIETRHTHEQPITLLLPFKNAGSLDQARTLIFSHLTTSGTGLSPTGGTATKEHARTPSFAMIIRPELEQHPHLYSPTWRITDFAELQLIYSQKLSHIEGNFLPLIANRAHAAATRAWMFDTFAAINTEYGWSEEGA
jgi:hypothetical protein